MFHDGIQNLNRALRLLLIHLIPPVTTTIPFQISQRPTVLRKAHHRQSFTHEQVYVNDLRVSTSFCSDRAQSFGIALWRQGKQLWQVGWSQTDLARNIASGTELFRLREGILCDVTSL